MTIYVKESGYDYFFRVDCAIRTSRRGNEYLHIISADEISRSAFYKYRDSIAPFQNLMAGRIITFYTLLKDTPGVLSNILSIFANSGANILTINQAIPSGGRAMVTVSAETGNLGCSLEEFTRRLGESTGVVKAEVVAG